MLGFYRTQGLETKPSDICIYLFNGGRPGTFGDRHGIPLSGMKCVPHASFFRGTVIHHSCNVPFRKLPPEWKRGTGNLCTKANPRLALQIHWENCMQSVSYSWTCSGFWWKCCGFVCYHHSKIRKQQRKIKGLACRHLLANKSLCVSFHGYWTMKNSHNSHSPVFGVCKLAFALTVRPCPHLPLYSHPLP